MGMPKSKEARLFYRAAEQRFTDAQFIFRKGDRTTAAVYLAGYAVECFLKALILSQLPGRDAEMLKQFRGGKAHDYDWFETSYIGSRAAPSRVDRRSLRSVVVIGGPKCGINPGTVDPDDDAEDVLDGRRSHSGTWADGRL